MMSAPAGTTGSGCVGSGVVLGVSSTAPMRSSAAAAEPQRVKAWKNACSGPCMLTKEEKHAATTPRVMCPST
jgi:hypothetical protein